MNVDRFFDSCIREFQEVNLNVLYFQVWKDNQLCGEYKCTENKARLNVYSISKSFVSAACGIACDEGLIRLDEKISNSFTEYLPNQSSDWLHDITPHHLLTMNSGLTAPLFFSDDPCRYKEQDWISCFWQADFTRPPGSGFLYSNLNTYMLSCLIEKRAGCNLLEYLRHRLFEPLDIGNPDWTLCPKGHVYAGFGLSLNIDELSNFGKMLLHQGQFNGSQLVPKEYLHQAFQKQVDSVDTFGTDALNSGYGYQFWKLPADDAILCFGGYGQFCLIYPPDNLVCSILSFEGRRPTAILDIMLKYLEAEPLETKLL